MSGLNCSDQSLHSIRKLPVEVINKIAAGEIVQRPSSAVKELIENSIDAKSNSISITVKDAGFKMLQIQDNGSGINVDDLPIACQRFTTSKLNVYEDLQTISTHGFRGEALASISHVSQLTIVTKIASSVCAYKAVYKDGKMLESPKPVAGNQGTLISIENLFYNMPLRRESLPNHAEEYNKIVALVTRYALQYHSVSFSLKKQGDFSSDFKSVTAPVLEKITDLFGTSTSKEVLELSINDIDLCFQCNGFISRPSYISRKLIFILFINNRLVECSPLRRSILSIYAAYLTKGSNPFVYLNLLIKGENVDVNVHPTKDEVRFLNDEEIIEKITKTVDRLLINTNTNATFIPKVINPYEPVKKPDVSVSSGQSSNPSHMVRTDPNLQTLDTFVTKTKHSSVNELSNEDVIISTGCSIENTDQHDRSSHQNSSFHQNSSCGADFPARRVFKLSSILNLRGKIESSCSGEFRDIIANCTYVGSIDPDLALIQNQTELFLINMKELSQQLFYQILIYDFGNFGRFSLSNSIPVKSLIELALSNSKHYSEKDTDWKKSVFSGFESMAGDVSEMLADYFSFQMSETGFLESFPMLLRDYEPSFEVLPELFVSMATEVNWDSEEECFHSFSHILAQYYAVNQRFWSHRVKDNVCETQTWIWIHQHVLLPAFRVSLQPSKFSPSSFTQVASLPQLYKVFERC